MGVSEPVFTCIKMKFVYNVQRRVNKGSDIPQSIEKQMLWKSIMFIFCFLQSWSRDQSECLNVSHSETQFLTERNLRST